MTTGQPDFEDFFHSYVAAFNRSLGESVDAEGIRKHFSDIFIAAGPDSLATGENDDTFSKTLEKGYDFYKSIGTTHMAVESAQPVDIDETHFLVKVGYHATYEKDGDEITIPFEVSYLIEVRNGHPKIFGFVAGDEMALYREHGLVPDAE